MKIQFAIISFVVILLTGCDTGSNNAPVINANALDSNSSASQLSDQASNQDVDRNQDVDQGTVQQGNVEVVPTNDIQVVNSRPVERESVESPPIEHNDHKNYSRKTVHREHARYIHHAAMDNDADDSTTLQYHDILYHNKAKKAEPAAQQSGWLWPAKGNVISTFSTSYPGIEIQGKVGESIVAVDAGTVIYSQNNVNRYGNMIIIAHANHLMSAYAYNQELLVKPGEKVAAGQKIATMGKSPENKPCVYFEVRRNGKPVNPVTYLSKTS